MYVRKQSTEIRPNIFFIISTNSQRWFYATFSVRIDTHGCVSHVWCRYRSYGIVTILRPFRMVRPWKRKHISFIFTRLIFVKFRISMRYYFHLISSIILDPFTWLHHIVYAISNVQLLLSHRISYSTKCNDS